MSPTTEQYLASISRAIGTVVDVNVDVAESVVAAANLSKSIKHILKDIGNVPTLTEMTNAFDAITSLVNGIPTVDVTAWITSNIPIIVNDALTGWITTNMPTILSTAFAADIPSIIGTSINTNIPTIVEDVISGGFSQWIIDGLITALSNQDFWDTFLDFWYDICCFFFDGTILHELFDLNVDSWGDFIIYLVNSLTTAIRGA